MGAVKPGRQLSYCINEPVSGLGSLLYICCSNSESGETNISGTNKTHRSTRTTRGRPVFDVNTKFAAEFTFCCVQKPNKRTYEEQESIVFSSSFFVKHYCAKAKKIEPQLIGIKQNAGARRMNFCVGDIKHIKTTANKLDLECILQTRWAPFCISPQSPIFSQVFAKTNSLIKNIFEEKKV